MFLKISVKFIKNFGKVNLLVIISVLCLILYDEFLCYKMSRHKWKHFSNSKNSSVRILLVADPQIVGIQDEHWLFGFMTRWDCDRYLRSGFKEALSHTQPDVVIFLGDLFDEGSSATDYQYEGYVSRFNGIFKVPEHIQKVFIPGDNDIAREGFNFIERRKKERFDTFFHGFSKPVVSVNFVDILRMEDYSERIDLVQLNTTKILSLSKGKIRLFCNHFGIVDYLPKLRKSMEKIQPNLIIAGHEHQSAYWTCFDCWSKKRRLVKNKLNDNEVFLNKNLLKTSNTVYQVVVPTCSYRMGASNMGYGFMVIDNIGYMSHTVLWLPDRYEILNAYKWFFGACIVALIFQLKSSINVVHKLMSHTLKFRINDH